MGQIKTIKTVEKNTNSDSTVEVLYQKMGDRWFAFSLIDDEVFVGSLSSDEIHSSESDEIDVHAEVASRSVESLPKKEA